MKNDPFNEAVRFELGQRIRALREAQGLSLRTFALMAGINTSYLVAVEHGRRNVSIDNLANIAVALGTTLSSMFEGVDGSPERAEKDKGAS